MSDKLKFPLSRRDRRRAELRERQAVTHSNHTRTQQGAEHENSTEKRPKHERQRLFAAQHDKTTAARSSQSSGGLLAQAKGNARTDQWADKVLLEHEERPDVTNGVVSADVKITDVQSSKMSSCVSEKDHAHSVHAQHEDPGDDRVELTLVDNSEPSKRDMSLLRAKEGSETNLQSLHDKFSNSYKSNDSEITQLIKPHDQTDMAVNRPDAIVTTDSTEITPSESEDSENSYSTQINLIIYFVSIITYIVDIGSDIFVAYQYATNGDYWWFGLTLTFIVVPSLTMTILSLKWYIQDHGDEKASVWRWASRSVFLFLQIAPILRYIDAALYGCQSHRQGDKNKKKDFFRKMQYEDVDSTLLRLIECFMEAAPQLCLQLYIMISKGSHTTGYMITLQVVSCSSSLLSMSWSLVSYHRSLRSSLPFKEEMSWPGSIMQFTWKALMIAGRVLTFAVFAARYDFWIAVLVGCHWMLMLGWIYIFLESSFCGKNNKVGEFFFNIVMAVVYIFTFLNLTEGHTRLRYLFFYCVTYGENIGMIAAWYVATATSSLWYQIPVLAVVVGGFPLGVICQIIYYLTCHPNNRLEDPDRHIKVWIPCSKLLGQVKDQSHRKSQSSEQKRTVHSKSNNPVVVNSQPPALVIHESHV